VINIADDEYTPEQRRLIDARLALSKDDFKNGRTYGPFETASEMIDFLHAYTSRVRRDTARLQGAPP
jgi:hypothetical protein